MALWDHVELGWGHYALFLFLCDLERYKGTLAAACGSWKEMAERGKGHSSGPGGQAQVAKENGHHLEGCFLGSLSLPGSSTLS